MNQKPYGQNHFPFITKNVIAISYEKITVIPLFERNTLGIGSEFGTLFSSCSCTEDELGCF